MHDDRNEDEGETITTEKTTTTTSTTTTPRTSTTTSRSTRATKSTTPYYEEDENDIDDSGSRESSTTKSSVTINYDGDYETVDDHRRKFNTTNEDRLALPDICQGQFDAVSVLRNELFFFKNQVSSCLPFQNHITFPPIIIFSKISTAPLLNLNERGYSMFGGCDNAPLSTTDIRLISATSFVNYRHH